MKNTLPLSKLDEFAKMEASVLLVSGTINPMKEYAAYYKPYEDSSPILHLLFKYSNLRLQCRVSWA